MIRLMKNEIIKLLKKKSFYIVTFIFVLFCILTNVVYDSSLDTILEENINIEEIEAENKGLDLSKEDDLAIYVDNLTTLKIEELKEVYSSNEAKFLIENNLYSLIYQMYESKYVLEDEELYQKYNLELENNILKIENNDWSYFKEQRIKYLEKRVNETKDIEKERYQALLKLALYRKEKDVPYDEDHYLHTSILYLEENMYEYINLLHDDNLTKEEESRLSFLKENMSIHEYVLEHQQDILNEHTLRAVFTNFSGEFGIFILIYVIMLAGSIVSEEYSRGTIKYLLTKPFKRRTILTSKLLVVILFIPLIMLFMSFFELLIGGIILGFDSLSVPVVLYTSSGLVSYSVLEYLGLLLLSSLPMYYVIGMVAFMISTVTASTSAAITISFLFYLLGNVISNLALIYSLPIFKVFVSLYWDFSYLVTVQTQPFGASILTSILVVLAYIFLMLCIAYVFFMKKDVKNF
mgnify:CR=1 FL=1